MKFEYRDTDRGRIYNLFDIPILLWELALLLAKHKEVEEDIKEIIKKYEK